MEEGRVAEKLGEGSNLFKITNLKLSLASSLNMHRVEFADLQCQVSSSSSSSLLATIYFNLSP